MVIRHIHFHHFLLYHGDQRLELPTDGDRTLTVVVGPNNSGKTSIIRGLKFWFYGEKGLVDNTKPLSLMSNRAKAAVDVGGTLETWVEVCFTRSGLNGPETLTLRRVIEAKKVAEDRWDLRSLALFQVSGGARPQLRPDDGNKYQRMLEAMVPPALFDAFYFKGEPLDGKLLGDVGSIREALGQFLHEDQWKEAEKATAEIRDSLSKQLEKLTEANKALHQKVKEQQRNQEHLEEQRAALAEEQEKLQQARIDYTAAADQLAKFGNAEAAQELKKLHVEARRKAEHARSTLDKTDADLQREIGQSLGLPFLTGAIEPVRKILAEMERDNILPADITPGFVDRVLERRACICGKAHDEDSRTNWEEYKRKTLAADTGEGLRKLLDWVKPTGSLSIEKRAEQTRTELDRLLKVRQQAAAALNDAELEVKRCQKEMESVPLEEIAQLGRRLNALQTEIESQGRRVRVIEDSLRATEYAATRLKEEVDRLSGSAGVDQNAFQKLKQAKDRAEKLLQALKFCRGYLGQYFHRALQDSVAGFYNAKATDGSKAHIDRQTLLPSILVEGAATKLLGGGQSQLMALAYVVSLARLRQDMHAQMAQLGVNLGKIDDLSFFMDSPLGNMETNFKTAAVQLLPGSARQVVVLLWREEWDFARHLLEPVSDAIWAIKFFGRAEDLSNLKKEDRIYRFNSGPQALVQELPRGEGQPHSQIERIH